MYQHSDYFNRYEFYPFNNNKSKSGKFHTDMIKNKDFKGTILDLIDMLLETHPENVLSECCGVKLTKEDICEFVYFLFYPHFELAKDAMLDNYIEPDECITLFLKGLKSADKEKYFSNEKDRGCFDNYFIRGKKEIAFNKRLQERLTNNEIFEEFDEVYKYFIFRDCDCETVTHISKSYSGLLCNLMQIGNDTISKKIEDKANNCIKLRKNRIVENVKKSRLYDVDDYFMSECDDEEYTKAEFKILKKWYTLFNKDDDCYFKVDGENKFLELQLLDMRFGCSVAGYVFEKFPKSHALNILEICSVFGVLGLTNCAEKIIKKVDDFCKLDDDYFRNGYRNCDKQAYDKKEADMKNDIINLYKSVMKIFRKLTYEFAEYLHFLESYDKRKDYFKGTEIEEPCVLTDKWRYFLSEQCENDCKRENCDESSEFDAFFPWEIYYTYNDKLNPIDEFYSEYLFKFKEESGNFLENILKSIPNDYDD